MIKQGIEDPDIGVVVKALTDDNARPEFGYCSLQSIDMAALLGWIEGSRRNPDRFQGEIECIEPTAARNADCFQQCPE